LKRSSYFRNSSSWKMSAQEVRLSLQQNRTGSGTKCVRRRNDSWLLASLDSSKMNVLVLKRRSRLKEQIADVRQRQL
jgi:hypothetical protein